MRRIEMSELIYLATAKFDDFLPDGRSRITDRALETEVSALGARLRLALGESPGNEAIIHRFKQILAHLASACDAQTTDPQSCETLVTRDWFEFSGYFEYGARLSDLGLEDRGVYTFTSLENPPCSARGEQACPNIQLILCGSREHVLTEPTTQRTRMGSGSDWLHDLAAVLVERVARGDTSFPEELYSASRRDKEFAARSAYDMLAPLEGPAYLHGHARVVCNFSPGARIHRLIVATPLYVEVVPRPVRRALEATNEASAAPSRRRLLPRFARRSFGVGEQS